MVSSANLRMSQYQLYHLRRDVNSKKGPSTDPCGTLLRTVIHDDSSTVTLCFVSISCIFNVIIQAFAICAQQAMNLPTMQLAVFVVGGVRISGGRSRLLLRPWWWSPAVF